MLVAARALLASGGRLTLLGPAGVGKTRLAQALTAERTGRFVALDAASQLEAVRERVQRSLRPPQPPLLVVDGCERLGRDAVAWLDEAIPPLWPVVATSRRELGWSGERCLEVLPLDPAAARRVFVDAAVRPLPAVHLDRVVARLGRLPGALRLAASCLDLVDLSALERSLGDPGDEVWCEPRYERLAPLKKLVLRHFPDGDWRIDAAGTWHEPPGVARQPIKGAANRRLLAFLLERRLSHPGVHVDSQELARAGWPDDRLPAKATGNRVRVALSTLRSAGLADLIERGEHGWRLTPLRVVHRVG